MRKERITAIIVSRLGTWNADGLTESGSFSLTTYRRYADLAEFKADNGGRNVPPGIPIYRFDRVSDDLAIDHSYKGAMADDSLPPRSMKRLLGENEPWDASKPAKALDYVSRDIHVMLAEQAGIPVERS